MLTRQFNSDRVIFKTVFAFIDVDSQIDLKVVLPDVLDHEATVSLLFLSNELCFPPVHLQHSRVIGVKNIRCDASLPEDFDIASFKIQRTVKPTLYGHIRAWGGVNVPRHIDRPVLSCVRKQSLAKIYIT